MNVDNSQDRIIVPVTLPPVEIPDGFISHYRLLQTSQNSLGTSPLRNYGRY